MKKNKKLCKMIARNHKLIGEVNKRMKELDGIQKAITDASWELKGEFMYQYMQKIISDIKNGRRAISIEECEDNTKFIEVDRDAIKSFAERAVKWQKMNDEFFMDGPLPRV